MPILPLSMPARFHPVEIVPQCPCQFLGFDQHPDLVIPGQGIVRPVGASEETDSPIDDEQLCMGCHKEGIVDDIHPFLG